MYLCIIIIDYNRKSFIRTLTVPWLTYRNQHIGKWTVPSAKLTCRNCPRNDQSKTEETEINLLRVKLFLKHIFCELAALAKN